MSKGSDAVAARAASIDAAGGDIADGVKRELATKLAWAVGSTLHVGYSNKGTVREWAERMAERLYGQRMEMLAWASGSRPKPKLE